MASTIKLRIQLEIDDIPERGFPLDVVLSADEIQAGDYDEAADNDDTTFSALPVDQIDTVSFLMVRVLNAIGLRVEGSEATNVALRLDANGGMIAWGTSITNTNITVNVNSASVARVKFVAGGT